MKHYSLAVALLTAVPALAGPSTTYSAPPISTGAANLNSGGFLGIKGSALWVEDIGYTARTAFGDIQLDGSFDVGWGVTLPFGYRFDNGLSLGGSVGYYTADVDEVSVRLNGNKLGNLNLDADGVMVPLLVNAAYSFSLSEAISLTLGAGAGVAWHEFEVDRIDSVRYDASFDGWDFSFQAFAGVNFALSPTADLTLGYRYVQTETDEDSIQGHNVEAGVVIRF